MKKAAVGATAAGIVWSAPKVEGFSLRPDYAAAGSGVGGGGVVAGNVNLIFTFTDFQDLTSAAGTTQLGSNASGNPAFASVRGFAQRTRSGAAIVATNLRLTEVNWNGVGTAFVNAMNTGGNVGSPTPAIDAPTSLPVGQFDAAANVQSVNNHTWRTSFSCA